MTDIPEPCPICDRIKTGKILSSSNRCHTIRWGDDLVAVLDEHREHATPEEVEQALDLLNFDAGSKILTSFEEVAGHWGIRVIGKSADDPRIGQASE